MSNINTYQDFIGIISQWQNFAEKRLSEVTAEFQDCMDKYEGSQLYVHALQAMPHSYEIGNRHGVAALEQKADEVTKIEQEQAYMEDLNKRAEELAPLIQQWQVINKLFENVVSSVGHAQSQEKLAAKIMQSGFMLPVLDDCRGDEKAMLVVINNFLMKVTEYQNSLGEVNMSKKPTGSKPQSAGQKQIRPAVAGGSSAGVAARVIRPS